MTNDQNGVNGVRRLVIDGRPRVQVLGEDGNTVVREVRIPTYLSPSALLCFLGGSYGGLAGVDYYKKYIMAIPEPRFPQTEPMAVGSAFDCYVKSYINARLGLGTESLEFDALFPLSVEEGVRDFARRAGAVCFDFYKASGALGWLLSRLEGAASLGMEDSMYWNGFGVPLHGKPDLWVRVGGVVVVLDWKVNGFMAARPTTPAAGYLGSFSPSGSGISGGHKKCILGHDGLANVNPECSLKRDWLYQTTTYDWMLGGWGREDDTRIRMIHQLCGDGMGGLRGVYVHGYLRDPIMDDKIASEYRDLWNRISRCWEYGAITGDASLERKIDFEMAAFTPETDMVSGAWDPSMAELLCSDGPSFGDV